MTTLIHITHEAREKMGGIGAVLEGLLTARAYQAAAERTILLGNAEIPLSDPPADLETVLYQTGDALPRQASVNPCLLEAFARIEATYGVRILYGRRAVAGPLQTRRARAELVLLDVQDARADPVNRLKGELWEAYGLQSNRFEDNWGYEEWVRVAGPALEIVEAFLEGCTETGVLIGHEFMGLPTLLAARLRLPGLRTVYWAHEVPPVRDLIEKRTSHRLVFDLAMKSRTGRRSYEAMLREGGGFKHALVSRAHRAHHIFAVSDRVACELLLLDPAFRRTPIEVVYNGLPGRPIDLEMRMRSRNLLRQYVEALLGFRPDYVFTHVARPVASKSLERDLWVLEHLDDILAERDRTAALVVLATDGGRRPGDLVRRMETEYGWPLHHRVGWPDLVKGEVAFGQAVEGYNRWARATRAVLINQFGLSRECCGDRVPEELLFQDLRQGSDVEFGQSAYEPFGIAPLETLAFGGISVISTACGCAPFLTRVSGDALPENVLLVEYVAPAGAEADSMSDAETERIEHEIAARLAARLADRLPTGREALARLLESGWELTQKMSWEVVARDYLLPALQRCLGQKDRTHPAATLRRARS
ncbi:MAG TPA: hypothetical protein VM219_03560 [Phycisphaerae bacterium]|nr:hypothetical protein [Phycisphaerae bacterium]